MKENSAFTKFKDLSPDVICSIDSEGKFTELSSATQKLWGYYPDELIGKSLRDFVFMDDLEILIRSLNDNKAGQGKIHFESRFIHKNSSLRPMSWIVQWDSNLQTTFCIARDASEKLLNESAFIDSEKKYKFLFENHPSPMFIWEFGTLRIIDCNEEALIKYGYSREEFLRLTIRDIRPVEDIELIDQETMNEAVYGKKHKKVWRHKNKNGEIMFMEVTGHLMMLNGQKVSFVQLNDVTEKLKAEALLETNEKRYRALVENGDDAVVILNAEYQHVFVSPTITRLLGYSEEEFLQIDLPVIFHPDDWSSFQEKIIESVQKPGLSIEGCTSRIKHKNGSWRWMEGNLTNLLHEPAINGIVDNFRDVTENMIAREQLTISEARHRGIIQSQTNFVIRTDLNGDYTFCNDTFIKEFGWNYPGGSPIGNNAIKSVAVSNQQRFTEAFTKCISTPDTVIKVELDRPGKEGETRTTLWDFIGLVDYNGKPTEIQCVGIEITDRKKYEESLANERNLLRTLIDNIPDFIYVKDKHCRPLINNQAIFPLLGVTDKDKATGKTITDYLLPESANQLMEDDRGVISSQQSIVNKEELITTIDGQSHWLLTTKVPIYDNNREISGLIGISRNITERKKREQHLKLLESVITNTTDSVLITEAIPSDEMGRRRILYVNEAFTKMTGYKSEEVVGKTAKMLLGPKSEYKELERMGKCMIKGEPCEITIINYKKNGDEFWIEISVSPVVDERGIITHWIAIERDVTERKNKEIQKALLAEIAQLFNAPRNLQQILSDVLHRLIQYDNYLIAEVWLVGADSEKINLSAKLSNSPESINFYETTASIKSFNKGEGLPGIAWETGNIQIWTNIKEQHAFLRIDAATEAGLETCCGLPLKYNEEVIGVLVLGSKTKEISCNNIIYQFEILSSQLGAEIKRKQLELELNQIFNLAPDIICIAGTDGLIKKANPAMQRLIEYTDEEILSIPFIEMIHPASRSETAAEISRLVGGSTTRNFENRLITKSGKVKWFLWTATMSMEEGHIFSVAKDITEKKELTELLEKATTMARIGSWEADVMSNQVYWSQITREIHEVTDDFLPEMGSAILFYKQGQSRQSVIDAVQSALDHGTAWDLEVQIVTAKGNVRWVRSIGESESLNGKCIRLYGSLQDIDEKKKTEETIRISNERYNIVSKVTNDSIWDWDLVKNEVLRPGKTLEGLIGYTDISPADVDAFWQEHVHPYDWNKLSERRNLLLADPTETFWEDEYRLLKPDKSYAIIYDRGYIMRNNQGVAIRMIGASRDITRLKESEQQLKILNEQLVKRAEELAISNRELEHFAYVASHDLQEPLRMVTGFVTQIEKKYAEMLDDKGRQYIHFAVDGAKRMRQIILDLLEFSRVGRFEEELRPVDMNEILREVIALYSKKIEETKACIQFDRLPVLDTFRGPVRQVFQNLISNALKYQQPQVQPLINILAFENDTHWTFTVQDNGIGIEEEYFEKIFVVFQRLHNKDEYSGTGIGLAICKKIVESLGGTIGVNSKPGKGTSIYFTLNKTMKI